MIRSLGCPTPPSLLPSINFHLNQTQRLSSLSLLVSMTCSQSFESSTHRGSPSSPYLVSVGRVASERGLPTPFTGDIGPSRAGHQQIPIPRMQGARAAITPFDTFDLRGYAEGFPVIRDSETSLVPRLRPASWDSPSRVDGTYESRGSARPSSLAELRGDSSGEEDLPFGRRTLPPLPIHYDPRRLDFGTTPNTSSAPSRDLSPEGGDPPATNTVHPTSFHASHSDGGYR